MDQDKQEPKAMSDHPENITLKEWMDEYDRYPRDTSKEGVNHWVRSITGEYREALRCLRHREVCALEEQWNRGTHPEVKP